MDKQRMTAILYALLAAMFYAINVPISKILLKDGRHGHHHTGKDLESLPGAMHIKKDQGSHTAISGGGAF